MRALCVTASCFSGLGLTGDGPVRRPADSLWLGAAAQFPPVESASRLLIEERFERALCTSSQLRAAKKFMLIYLDLHPIISSWAVSNRSFQVGGRQSRPQIRPSGSCGNFLCLPAQSCRRRRRSDPPNPSCHPASLPPSTYLASPSNQLSKSEGEDVHARSQRKQLYGGLKVTLCKCEQQRDSRSVWTAAARDDDRAVFVSILV